MKIIKLLLVFALSSALVACKRLENRARMVVPPEIKLGYVQPGARVTFNLPIKNEGDAELKLIDIKASCSCIVLLPKQDAVKIGESVQVEGVIDVSGRPGPAKQRVIISTNDPSERTVEVLITYNIDTLAVLSPARMVLWADMPVQPMKFELTAQDRHRLKAQPKISSSDAFIKVENVAWNENAMTFQLSMAPKMPAGEIMSEVVIIANIDGADQVFKLPIGGRCTDSMSSEPSSVFLSTKSTRNQADIKLDRRIENAGFRFSTVEAANILVVESTAPSEFHINLKDNKKQFKTRCVLYITQDGDDVFSLPIIVSP